MSLAGTSVVAVTLIVFVLAPTSKSKGAAQVAEPSAATGIVPLNGIVASVATAPGGKQRRIAAAAAIAKSRGMVMVSSPLLVSAACVPAMHWKRRRAARG